MPKQTCSPLFLLLWVLPSLLSAQPAWSASGSSDADEEPSKSVRLADPWTITGHTHFFQLVGFRLGHRISDERTEVSLFLGSAILHGCAIQTPKCIKEDAYGLGYRRYLFSSRFSGYAGFSLYYLSEGIRFAEEINLLSDFNLGIHWQFWSGFTFGIGWSAFVFNGPEDGYDLNFKTWFSSEIGGSF
jgi:hypothetical protein